MPPRPALDRLSERPLLSDWKPTELMTMSEAAALHFARGPLDAAALRRAVDRGELNAVRIAGKLFTTSNDITAMIQTDSIGFPAD